MGNELLVDIAVCLAGNNGILVRRGTHMLRELNKFKKEKDSRDTIKKK